MRALRTSLLDFAKPTRWGGRFGTVKLLAFGGWGLGVAEGFIKDLENCASLQLLWASSSPLHVAS